MIAPADIVTARRQTLTEAEQLKFELLSRGLTIEPTAQTYIDERNGSRPMTPADYASTSGIILELEDDVWVNAPIALYNPNFVHESDLRLVVDDHGLAVAGTSLRSRARFWLPPAYHGALNEAGEAYNSYAFTHGDRVRISPIEGCAMACQFCDLPYEFKYRRKTVAGLVDAVSTALSDTVQPAAHVLISGGTPHARDFGYLHETYEAVIGGFPDVAVDIMMVPTIGLLDVAWLAALGVHELSINLEIFDQALARRIMRRKSELSLAYYLDFIERAVEALGPGRVRSMLLVGTEPLESTLAGVDAIAARGGTPVLSPFRPDPATPMRKVAPPTPRELRETYLRARDVAARRNSPLGPTCIPCTHNTMTLAVRGSGDAHEHFGSPRVV